MRYLRYEDREIKKEGDCLLGLILTAVFLVIVGAAYYFVNPFYAPFATLEVDDSDDLSFDRLIDRYLNEYGADEIDVIEEKIEAWKARKKKKAAHMFFRDHRLKQLEAAMRDKPFVVIISRGKTRYHQQYSYEELRERLEKRHRSSQYALGNAKVAFKTSF